MFPSWQVVSSI